VDINMGLKNFTEFNVPPEVDARRNRTVMNAITHKKQGQHHAGKQV